MVFCGNVAAGLFCESPLILAGDKAVKLISLDLQSIGCAANLLPHRNKVTRGHLWLQVISEDLGLKLETTDISMMGRAKKITITKDDTIILDGSGDKSAIAERCDQIREAIAQSQSDYDRSDNHRMTGILPSSIVPDLINASIDFCSCSEPPDCDSFPCG